MLYLDFDLEIGPADGDEYPVSVRSVAGQTIGKMSFPFTPAELPAHLKDVQMALLRSSGEYRGAPSLEEQAVQQFGQKLFGALLTDEVGRLYAEAQRMAADQEASTGVRLRLAIAPPHLAALPWEFLYDPVEDLYPCLLPDTSLVRSLDLARPVPPLKVTPPLRVLGMIASPSDQPPLNVTEEQDQMRRAFAPLQESGKMELHWVKGQSWQMLQDALDYHGPWHIFHFIGHGGIHPESGDSVLAFVNERGTSHLLSADELATLLVRRMRLVVLNACDGARGNDHDIFSSTAATLSRRGIPGVLAMQYAISDTAAIQLTNKLYSALARGLPLDEAVVAARQAIKLSRSRTLEWGTPVLYLRAQDGVLFEMTEQPASQASKPRDENLKTKERWVQEGDALAHYTTKRYAEALAYYEQALVLDPGFARAYSGKAEALNELKHYEEALAAAERAIQLGPQEARAYNGKGAALYSLKRYEEALAAAKRAIQLDPQDAYAHLIKGNALYSLKRYEEALAVYERAIRLDRHLAPAYTGKGMALADRKRYEDALGAYERALQLDPQDGLAHRNKGAALRALGRIAEAEEAEQKARELGS